MNEDVLKNLKSEFKLWGIRPHVEYLNSGHIELVWQATPDKPERRHVIAKTGSDWRGWLNARSIIRRQFKQDGLSIKEQIRKPKPVITKALELPEPIERDVDQIKLLRAEVADLSELTLRMMTMLKELIAVSPPVDVPAFIAPPPPAPSGPSIRSIKAIDFVSNNWNSLDALARDMGVDQKFAYRKLYYLLKQGDVELENGRWRKKQQPAAAIIPEVAKRKARGLNGHHKH